MFDWAGGGLPPPQWDLRDVGWALADRQAGERRVKLIDLRGRLIGEALTALDSNPEAALCLFLGVEDSRERAKLLEHGGGDALPASACLGELKQRARRLWSAGEHLPRERRVGPLVLDLLHRDAHAEGRWLALHPREFGLMWRLADRPGEPVSRAGLLRDVWRLDFDPGTNSIEVHVSRLRRKLGVAGLRELVETHADGGYRLTTDAIAPERPIVEERLCA